MVQHQSIGTSTIFSHPNAMPQPSTSPRGNNSLPTRLPSINLPLPKFEGDEVIEWIYKCEWLFTLDNTPEYMKVTLASIVLEGRASVWHRAWRQPLTWKDYVKAIYNRFGWFYKDDLLFELMKEKQRRTIDDYLEYLELKLSPNQEKKEDKGEDESIVKKYDTDPIHMVDDCENRPEVVVDQPKNSSDTSRGLVDEDNKEVVGDDNEKVTAGLFACGLQISGNEISNEDKDDNSMEKDGNEIDGQKHIKSAEPARESNKIICDEKLNPKTLPSEDGGLNPDVPSSRNNTLFLLPLHNTMSSMEHENNYRQMRSRHTEEFFDTESFSIMALSPLDGRYVQKVKELHPFFCEYGLIQYRIMIEVKWLLKFSEISEIKEVPNFSKNAQYYLESILSDFNIDDALEVKKIEKVMNRDVKTVEFFMKQKCKSNTEIVEALEFLHFACTSEDINNLTYALMLKEAFNTVIFPVMIELLKVICELAKETSHVAMLFRTQGQSASPATLGKEWVSGAVLCTLQKSEQSIKSALMEQTLGGMIEDDHKVIEARRQGLELKQIQEEAIKLLSDVEDNSFGKAIFMLGSRSEFLFLNLEKEISNFIMNIEEPLKDYAPTVQFIKALIVDKAKAFRHHYESVETTKLEEIFCIKGFYDDTNASQDASKILANAIIIIWNWFYKDLVKGRHMAHPGKWQKDWRIAWSNLYLYESSADITDSGHYKFMTSIQGITNIRHQKSTILFPGQWTEKFRQLGPCNNSWKLSSRSKPFLIQASNTIRHPNTRHTIYYYNFYCKWQHSSY